jgi:hypothetical protein
MNANATKRQYLGVVFFRAFEDAKNSNPRCQPKDVNFGVYNAFEDIDHTLSEVYKDFNHAIPEVTGQLAERYKTRSLSVGDFVALRPVVPGEQWHYFHCAPIGWDRATPEQVEKFKLLQ